MSEDWQTKHEQELTALDVRRMRELATECLAQRVERGEALELADGLYRDHVSQLDTDPNGRTLRFQYLIQLLGGEA